MRIIFRVGLFVALLLSLNCAARKVTLPEKEITVFVPAGVDSSVALVADSLADRIMVSEERKAEARALMEKAAYQIQLSDSLWQFYQLISDSNVVLTMDDSIRARKHLERGIEALKEWYRIVNKIKKLQRKQGWLAKEVIQLTTTELLRSAQYLLENAIKVNPFDFDPRIRLTQVLEQLAVKTFDRTYYQKAVGALENMLWVQKGEHELYRWLGENYFTLRNWTKAYENFRQAQQVLERTAIFKVTDAAILLDKTRPVPMDTARLVYYLYRQAEAKAKLYNDRAALSLLHRALTIAPSMEEEKNIQGFIDWINWDDGNIRASEIRDSLVTLERKKEYDKAKRGYLNLLTILKTERTADEINWKIAVLDFQFLDHKNEAVDRLLKVVTKTPKDSSGAPMDSTYRVYFKDFGTMCHNLGIEYLDAHNDKIAYMYFTQAAALDWPNRGSSYLKLASLSTINAEETLEKCKLALQGELTLQEQQQVYELMFQAYKKMGNFQEARKWYKRYQESKYQTR